MRLHIPAVALSLAIAGCVPWPHRANITPGVAGSLTSAAQPVPAADLRLVASADDGSPCEGESRAFKTTRDGQFYGEPLHTFSWFMVVMGHGFFPWALCIQDQEQWVPLHAEKTYTLVDTGPAFLVDMECVKGTAGWSCKATQDWAPTPERIAELGRRNP
jgi:hypothetical protein